MMNVQSNIHYNIEYYSVVIMILCIRLPWLHAVLHEVLIYNLKEQHF
jgi:hypothetical protein